MEANQTELELDLKLQRWIGSTTTQAQASSCFNYNPIISVFALGYNQQYEDLSCFISEYGTDSAVCDSER